MVQVYELSDSTLTAKGSDSAPDEHYILCQKTEFQYVFSNNCKIDVDQYLNMWTNEKDHTVDQLKNSNFPSPFFQKYGSVKNLLGSLSQISIDRGNLNIKATGYDAWTTFQNKEHGYMLIYRENYRCTLSKPRI